MSNRSVDVEILYREKILSLSAAQRLIMACRMFSTAKAFVRAGILKEHGEFAAENIRELLFQRIYGRDFSTSERKKIVEYLKAI